MRLPDLRRKCLVLVMVAFAGIAGAQAPEWPALPEKAFVSGRPATKVDVNEGRAVFVLMDGDTPVGHAIAITIPQYALMAGSDTSPPLPVVVVQAEEFPAGKLVGVRDATGKEYVVLLSDLKLLGTAKPESVLP